MNFFDKKIFKVGFLLQDFKMNKFEKDIIDKLSFEKNIELYAIFEKKKNYNIFKKTFFIFKKNSILRNIEILFFKIFFLLEKNFLIFFFPHLKELNNKYIVNNNIFKKIINVNPVYSRRGIYNEYTDEDFSKIKKEDLDLVVRSNVSEIFRNNKLEISKLGIISFHHGDNTWNKGGPPGFWETYYNFSATGFIIQLLNERLDDGKILLKGEFPTKRLFTLNKYNLLRESNNYLIEIIKKIISNDTLSFVKSDTSKAKIYKTPNILITLRYILIKINLFSILFWKKFILRKRQKWIVNYSRKSMDKIDFKNSNIIKNPKNRYFADPFVFSKDEKKYIFVEDYSFKKKKGAISLIEINKKDNQKIYENIIEEPFHMSFPYVFKYENNLYMIPETSAANSIRLYKCVNFPDKWVYCYNLISNIKSVDTIILKKNMCYYLLTSKSFFDDFNSQLEIYISDSPISKIWKSHKSNPVYFDLKNGRNGGLIFKDKEILRVSQSFGINEIGDNQYGREISIKQIKALNSEIIKEIELSKVKPSFKKNILGIHHLYSEDNFTVFDYCKYD